jgi:hypothetical protein
LDYFWLQNNAYSEIYGRKFLSLPFFFGTLTLPIPLTKDIFAELVLIKGKQVGATILTVESDLAEIAKMPWCAATIAVESHLAVIKRSRVHLNQLRLYVRAFVVMTHDQMTRLKDMLTPEALAAAASKSKKRTKKRARVVAAGGSKSKRGKNVTTKTPQHNTRTPAGKVHNTRQHKKRAHLAAAGASKSKRGKNATTKTPQHKKRTPAGKVHNTRQHKKRERLAAAETRKERMALSRITAKQKQLKSTFPLREGPPDGGYNNKVMLGNHECPRKPQEKLKYQCPLCLGVMLAAHFMYKVKPFNKFRCRDCQLLLRYGLPDEKPQGQKKVKQFTAVTRVSLQLDLENEHSIAKARRNARVPTKTGTAVLIMERNSGNIRQGWLAKDSVADGRHWKHAITFTGEPMKKDKDVMVLPHHGKYAGVNVSLAPTSPDLRTHQRSKGFCEVKLGFNQKQTQCLSEKKTFLDTIGPQAPVLKDELNILHKDDLQTLVAPKWMTGTIITRYLRLVVRSLQEAEQDVYVMTPRFWKDLTAGSRRTKGGGFVCHYAKVRRWLIQAKIPLRSKTAFVINVDGNHWATLVVTQRHLRYYKFEWYDSYHSDGAHYINVFVKVYDKLLKEARKEYKKHKITRYGDYMHDKPLLMPNELTTYKVPKQPKEDWYNCGAFMCANVYCVFHDLDPEKTFVPADMERRFRKHMMFSVLQQKLQNLLSYPDDRRLLARLPAPGVQAPFSQQV